MSVTPSEGVAWPPELIKLQAMIDNSPRHALLAREWDRYERLLKRHDPAAAERRKAAARRRLDMEAAMRLSVEDLQAILAEKAN